jgi:hypothetical protein
MPPEQPAIGPAYDRQCVSPGRRHPEHERQHGGTGEFRDQLHRMRSHMVAGLQPPTWAMSHNVLQQCKTVLKKTPNGMHAFQANVA